MSIRSYYMYVRCRAACNVADRPFSPVSDSGVYVRGSLHLRRDSFSSFNKVAVCSFSLSALPIAANGKTESEDALIKYVKTAHRESSCGATL